MKGRGVPLEKVGRAERWRRDAGEAWRLPLADAAVARRLAALGAEGVGGFADGGTDDEGAWLLRMAPTRTLADVARGERIAWQKALRVVRDLARALRACERGGLFPGPLRPREVGLEPSVAVMAETLVRALVGGEPERHPSSEPARWTPPEQAAGAPWDNAANRYVLGLIAYRLLAGTSPFGGAGLRFALAAQQGGAPPFEDEVARTLRPGVQSFVLKLLAPSRDARPADAASIAQGCDALLAEEAAPRPSSNARSRLETAAHSRDRGREAGRPALSRTRHLLAALRGGSREGSRRRRPSARAALPLGVGALVACAALAAGAGKREIAAPVVHEVQSLRTATAADCAPCHAREVAEWERSVMAHSVQSPLFGALESLVEEQVGRDADCIHGAGILRRTGSDACRARNGIAVTGAGGEQWCVNCHAPGEKLGGPGSPAMPPWGSASFGGSRAPVRDLLSRAAMEGISCAACHETIGPVAAHASASRGYEGNPTWISIASGRTFLARPEDLQGVPGIANSGYRLDASVFLGAPRSARVGDPVVHRRPPEATHAYLRTSEFCGACHDVRLFGSDTLGASLRGEHFKRLRNAYSEWRTWADDARRAGRAAPSCQGCHMSTYPGVCVPGAPPAGGVIGGGDGCPAGTRFEARPAGDAPRALVAPTSGAAKPVGVHYFTSIDLPLTPSLPDAYVDDLTVDGLGLPVGLRARRDLLLRHTFRFAIDGARRAGPTLEIPITLENTGAGHRVPAGFSQEREIWVELTVTDARGVPVYEVGKIASDDADLRDKVFLRVRTDDTNLDGAGRPLGLFGADVVDGPDVPRWSPNPRDGGTRFRGQGLINLQNGFLRCVRCIGEIDASGACQAAPGQGRTRADRFEDGAYDADSGECRGNLSGGHELFETYFPVGALDADRGIAKAPDAIIDTRSAPPYVPVTYTYALDTSFHPPPFHVKARLRFRSFPPFLVRAFVAYETRQASEGLRPSGPQVTASMLRRIEVVDVGHAEAVVE